MFTTGINGELYQVHNPVAFPKASGFLWNKKMMIHVNGRGYVTSQFMQPEPAKYSHGPMLEAKTFMQPEQGYFSEHPGRFIYVKDECKEEFFSVPYEPMRKRLDQFNFIIEKNQLSWIIQMQQLEIEMKLMLPVDEILELWEINIKNISNRTKKISIYPFFSIGYMSWMNQAGMYNEEYNSIICSSVTPYQKVDEYKRVKTFKDKTFLAANRRPFSWEANQEQFFGEGSIINPDGIHIEKLMRGDAAYELPAAIMQFKLNLEPGMQETYRFLFGPAQDDNEIRKKTQYYFGKNALENWEKTKQESQMYMKQGKGCLILDTPDMTLNHFVNHWLPRQIYYHGSTNRLTTDPQTRNYLQDNMGMCYIDPSITRQAFLIALSQQASTGAMPDGILLDIQAELKYINQVPHSDHCVWIPICLKAYLDETDDYGILDEKISFVDSHEVATVKQHIHLAMQWLIQEQNQQGLSYIRQGDWCDPMNMVGYKGEGVSSWLTLASAYAMNIWAKICNECNESEWENYFLQAADKANKAVNRFLWDGHWYGRGITDDGKLFGVKEDREGKIFLNPQSFAILSGAASKEQQQRIIQSVQKNLVTPYGYAMLAPAYTKMRDDIGRVTQKFPGTAENGSIYNHAAAFYSFAMYDAGNADEGYIAMRKMIPGIEYKDIFQREQLPVFVPNYYRGAYEYNKRTCGKSSQLFNTGTAAWIYRCVIEGLFGLTGCQDGLKIQPKLPYKWEKAHVIRYFRGAKFDIDIYQKQDINSNKIYVNKQLLDGNVIRNIQASQNYKVEVYLENNYTKQTRA